MTYDNFEYIYPPRPETKISRDQLNRYDDGRYLAQPKFNGDCSVLFTDGKGFKLMNRYDSTFKKRISDDIDFAGIHREKGWQVLCGELLIKNKVGETGDAFNQKFVVWDILVSGGKYLIGSTFEDRQHLIHNLFPGNRVAAGQDGIEIYDHLICTQQQNIYVAPTYTHGFGELFDEIIKVPLYEGLVLKRRDAKLEYGHREKNNHTWQVKCRRPEKNYRF